MSEPARIAYTRAEIEAKALAYMRAEFGPARDKDDDAKARYYENMGMLVDFISQAFPEDKNDN